jgi:hypothetical protein
VNNIELVLKLISKFYQTYLIYPFLPNFYCVPRFSRGNAVPLDDMDGEQRTGQERDGGYNYPSLLWMDVRRNQPVELPGMHSAAKG